MTQGVNLSKQSIQLIKKWRWSETFSEKKKVKSSNRKLVVTQQLQLKILQLNMCNPQLLLLLKAKSAINCFWMKV